MIQTEITTGIQTVTSTGAVPGTLDTSALSGDFTIKVQVLDLTAGSTARIVVEDTANATPFSDAQPVSVFDVAGQVNTPSTQDVRKYQVPSTRFGQANNKLRLNVQVLSGVSPSLSVRGWIEQ